MPFLAVLAPIAGVLGAVASAGVGIYGAMQSRQQSNYQAAAMAANAQAQEYNAQWARQTANSDARLQETQNKRMLGSQIAAIGASGVDMSGSPLDLLAETVSESKIQEENTRRTGQFNAQGYQFQADSMRSQAAATRRAGNAQMVGGLFSAGTSLLTSTANIGMNYQYNNQLRMGGY